jgi:hypothetical protein
MAAAASGSRSPFNNGMHLAHSAEPPKKKDKKSPLYFFAIFHATLHTFTIFELHLNIKEKRRGKKQQQECFMMAGDPIIGIACVALYYSRSTALTLGNSHPSEIIFLHPDVRILQFMDS